MEIFEEDIRNRFINNIKETCDGFCNNIRAITSTFTTISEDLGCSNMEFCEMIIRAIFHMKKHIPSYVKDFIADNYKTLQEEDFRDTLGLFFGAKYEITSEEWRKEGRTDLIVSVGNNIQKVIEFKLWGRNDYKDIVKQVIDRYLTEFDDVGFIFMVNSNKSPIIKKYLEYVEDRNTGYIT